MINEKHLDRKMKAKDLFRKWREKAEVVLTEILRKDKNKVVGLEFKTNTPGCSFAYTSGTNINEILLNGKDEYILETRDSVYSESPVLSERTYTPESLAWEMLEGLQSMYKYIPYNPRRNRLVRDIEKRTGINLKKI